MSADSKHSLDENVASEANDRLSRVMAELGAGVMAKFAELRILIIGARGVGIETAKDLVLTSPKAVTLYDNGIVQPEDLGTNFYLRESDVGKHRRAAASKPQLVTLNPYCQISVYEGELTEAFIKSFGAVIITDLLPLIEVTRINEICRQNSVHFQWGATAGVTAFTFADYGDKHEVKDATGVEAKEWVLVGLSSLAGKAEDKFGTVLVEVSARHGIPQGTELLFSDITGSFSVLNGVKQIRLRDHRVTETDVMSGKKRTLTAPTKFELDFSKVDDAKAFTPEVVKALHWDGAGLVVEVKPSHWLEFMPLAKSIVNPAPEGGPVKHMHGGHYFEGVGTQLHFALLATLEFLDEKKHLPRLHSHPDANYVIDLAEKILKKHQDAKDSSVVCEKIDKEIVRKFAHYARAELSGYCAFLGGLMAQELVKIWGKYSPNHQWLWSDHYELLGDEPPSDAIPENSRYDHQISIFGKAFQEKVENQKWFLVGVGALGCEYLKSFALMGLGTGPQGYIHITDMDNVALSNLSRQFLFRNEHVGKSKALSAGEVIKQINADCNITVHEMKVCPETENTFTDDFWDKLDGVWNALDNVHARQYSDSKCLLHKKPLMESGTQGVWANADIILPHKTRSYNDDKEADTGGIPACTLKNFPYEILHCIEWARPNFGDVFEQEPGDYNLLVQDKDLFFEHIDKLGKQMNMIAAMKSVKSLVENTKDRSIKGAIRLALAKYTTEFRDNINTLTHAYPKDARQTRVVEETKEKLDMGPFWTGQKRFPQVADFNIDEPLHFDFLHATTNLYLFMFGVDFVDRETVKAAYLAENYTAPTWEPKKGARIEGVDAEADAKNEGSADDYQLEDDLRNFFTELDTKSLKPLTKNDFEKDDDKNFHIDFITAASNLRGWNYSIKPATRQKVKITAGKIIAALSTTTAAICGLVSLEFYKTVLGFQYISEAKFKNSQINFGQSDYNFFAPRSAVRSEARVEMVMENPQDKNSRLIRTNFIPYPDRWSSWDTLDWRGDAKQSIADFVKTVPSKFGNAGVVCNRLFSGGKDSNEILFGHPLRKDVNAENEAKNPELSERMRAHYQGMVDSANAFNAAVEAKYNKPLVESYFETYGAPITESRRYILLSGEFLPPKSQWKADCESNYAELPRIRYWFK